MPEYDTILRRGTIVDGTGAPRYISDLAIKDGRIAQIGGLRNSQAEKVLDASGLVVAPGFVDLHTHYDAQIQWDPYCTNSGWHGVTSVAIGNCGFGFAPVAPKDRERAMLCLTRNEAIPYKTLQEGMVWDWETFPQFLNFLDRIPKGVNVLSYVPLTPIYGWVMGWEEAKKRRPTAAELEEMCRLVREGMDAGGCGWSAQVFGLNGGQRDYDGTPMITDLMTNDEILAFAKILGDRGEGFIELNYRERAEGGEPLLESAMDFYARVAKAAGRPILYQTVSPNAGNPELFRKRVRWLRECNQRGLRVYGQGATIRGPHEVTFEDWNQLESSVPWREATMGTPAMRKAKMQDPEMRRRLREDWDSGSRPGPGGTEKSIAGLIVQEVHDPTFAHYEGLMVEEIAAKEKKHIVDALLDLVVADDLKTEFAIPSARQNPEYTAELMRSPHVIPGVSDGGAHMKYLTFGSFPTDLITWLVRDEQKMTLEEAHYKLSYLPAFMGGFKDRGFLREGAPADIVVYDLEKLKLLPPERAEDLPGKEWRRVQRAEGYRWTLVNGQVTFEDGKPTGAVPGRLLRHGRAN